MFGESSTKKKVQRLKFKFDMSIRLKNQAGDHEEKSAKIAKVDKVEDDGDDYDIEVMEEKKDEDELEEEEDDGLEEYFSLQPYEIYDIVMNP